ncbi:MAG: hypothetical protein RLZZ600_587 [Actinomycetota bacterium]
MRFIATIVSLFIAAALLILGISFKFFSGPKEVSISIPSDSSVSYVVIDPQVLHIHSGAQYLKVAGADVNTVAYGQTNDVLSWLGGSSYSHVSVDAKSKKVSTQVVSAVTSGENVPTATAAQDQSIVSPAGSDMWIGEATAEKDQAILSLDIKSNQSVIVASSGKAPAPSDITVSWPLPQPTFLWMNDDVLMIVGGFFLLFGIGIYLWALWHMRRGQGPRRRGRMPKPPRPPRSIGRSTRRISGPSKGRRAISGSRSMVALALSGLVIVGVSACSTGVAATPTPSPTSTSDENPDAPKPVVTEQQLAVILGKVTTTLNESDQKLDSGLVATRLAGAALEVRLANYAIRKSNKKIAALPSLKPSPVQLFLPQTTALWPRSILAMVETVDPSKKDKQAPTVAVVMTQESPRSNYKVVYTINLEANQKIPEVAAATVGTPLVAHDTKLLAVSPQDLAKVYADVVNKKDKSKYASLFSSTSDSFRTTIAAERKAQATSKDVKVTFADYPGTDAIAFAAQNAGAIVAVQMNEKATFTPLNNRDLKLTGALKALAGLEISNRPIQATYSMQLFFYVPPVGSTHHIEMLGYTENPTFVKLLG